MPSLRWLHLSGFRMPLACLKSIKALQVLHLKHYHPDFGKVEPSMERLDLLREHRSLRALALDCEDCMGMTKENFAKYCRIIHSGTVVISLTLEARYLVGFQDNGNHNEQHPFRSLVSLAATKSEYREEPETVCKNYLDELHLTDVGNHTHDMPSIFAWLQVPQPTLTKLYISNRRLLLVVSAQAGQELIHAIKSNATLKCLGFEGNTAALELPFVKLASLRFHGAIDVYDNLQDLLDILDANTTLEHAHFVLEYNQKTLEKKLNSHAGVVCLRNMVRQEVTHVTQYGHALPWSHLEKTLQKIRKSSASPQLVDTACGTFQREFLYHAAMKQYCAVARRRNKAQAEVESAMMEG